jgi:F-type H+-transporting ATPase subunit epsilon
MATFQLDIITPIRQAFSEPVESVSVPTVDGTIEILPNHEPLFCALAEGEIKIGSAKKELFLAIGGGFMQVANKTVSILVSRAVHADEINEAEIKKAQESAKEAIKRKVTGLELEAAQAILKRSGLDLRILNRHKHRRTELPS